MNIEWNEIKKEKSHFAVCDWNYNRSSHLMCSMKKVFLKISQISQENTPAQVFSCEICKIFKNIHFKEHILWLLLLQ